MWSNKFIPTQSNIQQSGDIVEESLSPVCLLHEAQQSRCAMLNLLGFGTYDTIIMGRLMSPLSYVLLWDRLNISKYQYTTSDIKNKVT